MRNMTARKLRREVFNLAREANLSGWRSVVKRLISKFKKSNSHDLRYISEFLAHFPNSKDSGRLIDRAIQLASEMVASNADQAAVLNYCFILKPYISEGEKGILLVSFENQLDCIIDSGKVSVIQARYHIMFIPSWTGLFSPALFRLASCSGDQPVFVLPVHSQERAHVNRVGRGFVPLPFNAASWVNQIFFENKGVERDIDCLMVANFASFKRHWLLFKALKGLPITVSAICVGVSLGSRTAESIRLEAQDYGVSDRVTVVENPSQEDLRLYFQRAKVICAMSYREGSFIAVAEALMSGTPVVMFRNAHIGTKSLIVPENGALAGSVSELRERIMEFISFEDHDRIRQNAGESISAQANCRKLNDMLAGWSSEKGFQWTRDIEPFYSMRLSFYYFDDGAKDRLRGDYQYLKDQGIKINLP